MREFGGEIQLISASDYQVNRKSKKRLAILFNSSLNLDHFLSRGDARKITEAYVSRSHYYRPHVGTNLSLYYARTRAQRKSYQFRKRGDYHVVHFVALVYSSSFLSFLCCSVAAPCHAHAHSGLLAFAYVIIPASTGFRYMVASLLPHILKGAKKEGNEGSFIPSLCM